MKQTNKFGNSGHNLTSSGNNGHERKHAELSILCVFVSRKRYPDMTFAVDWALKTILSGNRVGLSFYFPRSGVLQTHKLSKNPSGGSPGLSKVPSF